MNHRRTPREKKLLSYAKDGRNTFAESRGIAHKAIARRKAKANRAFRHEESRALQSALGGGDDVFVARIRRKSWKKLPDAPLGAYVAARLGRRAEDGMNAADKASDLVTAGLKRAKIRRFMLKGPLQRRMPAMSDDANAGS
ncbi:MAG TPA: hypothetical protein VGB24_12635 [Longimicrobium sp.]|jgi:hypothetical protein|uniref:hypothetical protein n=1 Tax=Longimicrobium sp. TaxID=2029185 RepID=UPI002ED8A786